MTHDELLDRMRYYTDNKAAVAVYEHGTCVAGILRDGATRPFGEIAGQVLKIYEGAPKDGEGSQLGDFGYMDMDDGNRVITFMSATQWYHCCTVRTREELSKKPAVETSETEFFTTENLGQDAMLEALHGLAARAARTKDVKEKRIVRLWDPRGHSLRVEAH